MKLTREVVKILVDAYNDYPDIKEFSINEAKFSNGNAVIAVSYSTRLPATNLRPMNNSVH